MDFILEMYALDHPEELEFVRGGVRPLNEAETAAEWETRLLGRARDAMLEPMLPSEAVLARAASLERAASSFTPEAAARAATGTFTPAAGSGSAQKASSGRSGAPTASSAEVPLPPAPERRSPPRSSVRPYDA